jgi:type I restriction enzyme S subunit
MELRDGYKKTEFGVIPIEWSIERLDLISKRGTGHTPSKKFSNYYNGGIVWVSLADSEFLDKGLIDKSTIEISKIGIQNSSATIHPKGTVLMSRDAGIGKSAVAGVELAVSQHFITWTCIEKILHNWFLYHWLQFKKSEFERIAVGSTIKTIGLPYFEQYQIPIPPINEQYAIVSALRDTDALINSLEKLIEKKRKIKQGAMQQLLRPKKNWTIKSLSEVIIKKPKTSHQSSYGLPFGRFPFFTNSSNDKIEKYFNDYDFNDEAIIANTGGVAHFKYFKGKFASMSDCLVFTSKEKVKYLFYFLKSIEGFINDNCFTGSGIKHLDKKYFNEIKIALPEKSEQNDIIEILSDMDNEIALFEKNLLKSKMLKQGMMQELLTGKTRLV